MKTVLITGASSGIGKKTAEMLALDGYKVYGIGRNFIQSTTSYTDEQIKLLNQNFIKVCFDLSDVAELEKYITDLAKKVKIDILINNAGCAYYGAHETLTPAQITEMTTINLTVPMVLSNLLLKAMKTTGGTIINISSVTARGVNTHGCAYGATKAALTSFGTSLFEEARKTGVKVINIHPDLTATSLYRNADFTADEDAAAHLLSEDVANTIIYALKMPERMLLSDITIKPQKHKIKKKATI